MNDINTRIAESIMGWTLGRPAPFISDIWLDSGSPVESQILLKPDTWNPCERIEQAFMVVEKLTQKDPPIYLSLHDVLTDKFLFEKEKRWEALFRINYDLTEVGLGYGSTPAVAICLAALQTLETK